MMRTGNQGDLPAGGAATDDSGTFRARVPLWAWVSAFTLVGLMCMAGLGSERVIPLSEKVARHRGAFVAAIWATSLSWFSGIVWLWLTASRAFIRIDDRGIICGNWLGRRSWFPWTHVERVSVHRGICPHVDVRVTGRSPAVGTWIAEEDLDEVARVVRCRDGVDVKVSDSFATGRRCRFLNGIGMLGIVLTVPLTFYVTFLLPACTIAMWGYPPPPIGWLRIPIALGLIALWDVLLRLDAQVEGRPGARWLSPRYGGKLVLPLWAAALLAAVIAAASASRPLWK